MKGKWPGKRIYLRGCFYTQGYKFLRILQPGFSCPADYMNFPFFPEESKVNREL